MPYVNVTTNVPVSKEQERRLIDALGPAVEVILGKARQNLFIRIEEKAALYFGGTTEFPCAMVTIDLFGKSANEGLSAYTVEICAALKAVLAVERERVYISFTECRHWGAGGSTKTA